MPLWLFPAILPSRTSFSAVAGGEERVGGSIKAWLCAFLRHQGKSKARLTLNGQLFESMWQSEQSRVGLCTRITEETPHRIADTLNCMSSVLHHWFSVSLGNRAIGKKKHLSTTLSSLCKMSHSIYTFLLTLFFLFVCFFPLQSFFFFLSTFFVFLRNKPVDRRGRGQSKNGRYMQTARGDGYVQLLLQLLVF